MTQTSNDLTPKPQIRLSNVVSVHPVVVAGWCSAQIERGNRCSDSDRNHPKSSSSLSTVFCHGNKTIECGGLPQKTQEVSCFGSGTLNATFLFGAPRTCLQGFPVFRARLCVERGNEWLMVRMWHGRVIHTDSYYTIYVKGEDSSGTGGRMSFLKRGEFWNLPFPHCVCCKVQDAPRRD